MEKDNKEKTFEDIIATYGGVITKVCYYFSENADEFQDLRQEVFYNIWKGLEHFRNDSKISTWIYRISFNTCISFQRKEKNKHSKISLDDILELKAPEETHTLEKYNFLHRLISNLPYEDRAIILMWLDEKSYEEISELTGLNRNTVASRIKRIKDKLTHMSSEYEGI